MTPDAAKRYVARAFTLAMVFTADLEHAEAVVMAAIEALPRETFSESALLLEVTRTAWNRSTKPLSDCLLVSVPTIVPATHGQVIPLQGGQVTQAVQAPA